MTPENFVYWLQGFAELSGDTPTAEQWQSIRDHLALVLTEKTPLVPAPSLPLGIKLSELSRQMTC